METWYSLSLGDGMTSGTIAAEIEDSFARMFASAGSPRDMAVFTRPESEGRLHCEVIAYFAPRAGGIAKLFDAKPCGKPSHEGLNLLTGNPHCWEVIFPEGKG